MSCLDRHVEVLECVRDRLKNNTNDPYMANDIYIDDYDENKEPQRGITVSLVGDTEGVGTVDRDDINYIVQITRNVHSLGNDDIEGKALFRTNVRTTFHRKKIQCGDGCYVITLVQFGNFAIPQKWFSENNSVTAMRVITQVREARTC